MSILIANLKHLYQRRGLWFCYAVLSLILPALVGGIINNKGQYEGLFVVLIALSSAAGLFACSMQIDVATRPFSHCLPGYHGVKRQFLLVVAIVTSALFALIFLLYPGIGAGDKLLAIVAAFFAGMTSFWIGVLIAFSGSFSAGFMGFYPIIGILANRYDLHIILEKAIVAEPGIISIVGVAVTIAAWMLLACEGWFRRHCGANWIGFFDIWNWSKLRKTGFKASGKVKHSVLSIAFESACLGRIRSASRNIKGYLAGTIYATFGGLFCRRSTSIGNVFFMIVIICAAGYLNVMANMIYIIAGMLAINVRMPVHSTMLICGGRRERFLSTVFMSVVVAALISIAVTSLAAISHGLDAMSVMGPLNIDDKVVRYHPITLLGFYVPFMMLPVGFTLQLIFKRKQMPMMVAWVMFFLFCMVAVIIIDISNIWWAYGAMAIVATNWIIFLAVLRWVCMRRSLVI